LLPTMQAFSGLPYKYNLIEVIMKAIWNGEVIAESDRTVEIEGNQYFPPSSVKEEFLEASPKTSTCPWKGEARYYHLHVDGSDNENAAWYYPEPKKEASEIKGMIAFWNGVQIKD
jgi:uncharacterized protein (DUF427 family)